MKKKELIFCFLAIVAMTISAVEAVPSSSNGTRGGNSEDTSDSETCTVSQRGS